MWLSDQGKGDRWDDGRSDQTRELLSFAVGAILLICCVALGQTFFSILY